MIEKVISGGQTGVDRAALDMALDLRIPCGGWCPNGRLAEDGPLGPKYPLEETPSSDYSQRTEWNVRDSDGTLILHGGHLSGGTVLTVELAARHNRPCLILDLSQNPASLTFLEWARQHRIRVLNVAGPRESGAPGISDQASAFLRTVLSPV